MDKEYEELIGKRVQQNIYDVRGTLLIAQGTELRKSHILKLNNFNIRIEDIQIETPAGEQAEPEAEPGEKFKPLVLKDMVKRTENYLRELDDHVKNGGVILIDKVEAELLPIINQSVKAHNLYELFTELKENGDYRYKQTIGAAMIATALGKRLRLDESELVLLTTAASLYDIGSLKLPASIANKPTKLNDQEYAIVKKHTTIGYELLKNSNVDPRVALVALQHHEREDGSGYPNGLKGKQIDRLSKIVALADVYMAMISDRPYRPAVLFFEVIEEIHQEIIRGRFDSMFGMTMLDMLLSAQIGCNVILTDGRIGKIMLTNVNYPTKPLIALNDYEFIDLTTDDSIHIKEITG